MEHRAVTAPPHLLVWTDATELAGAEQALAVLLAHLPTDVRVTVAGCHPDIVAAVAEGRPSADRRHVPRLAGRRDLHRAPEVLRFLARSRPDAIHLNKTDVADLRYVELAARLAGSARIVSVVHHVERPATAPAVAITRRLAARAAANVAVGTALARQLEPILGLPTDGVTVIPNALPALVPSGPVCDPDGGGHWRLTVGVLARFVSHKAVDRVIAAVAAVDGVRLLVGGDGPERERLERQAWRLGVANRVEFLGWVAPEQVLDRCDVVASAARIEGHPLALLDAARRGLPIVAGDVGAVSEIVEHEVTGLLVQPDDLTSLCAAIERLAADPRLRRSLGRAAREAATTRTPSAMAMAYRDLYWPSRALAPVSAGPTGADDRPRDDGEGA
jgi:glycosyltransferase involved in cell wall biosynthesis